MIDFLENIRNKPSGAKKRIAFFTAFTFTGVIFIFWFVSIYPSFKEQNDLEKKVSKIESSPITSVSSIFADNFSKIKEQFAKVKEVGENFTKEAAYYTASSTATTTVTINNSQNTANTWTTVEGDL